MRSPWQLIKGFASRRKPDETDSSADEALLIPAPPADEPAPGHTPQAETEPVPDPKTQPAAGNETGRLANSVGAKAEPRPVARQTALAPPEGLQTVAPESRSQPVSAAAADHAINGKTGAGAVAAGTRARRAKPAQERETLGGGAVVEQVVKKTVIDELTEQDRQIENLRSELAVKLLEQNKQLRRMLERYGDR